MNYNVKLSLVFTFLNGTSRGIWAFTVLSGYLYVLTGSNLLVGLAEGIQGTSQALVAIPAGIYLTDGIGRDKTLKIGGIVGALTVGFTLITLLITNAWSERGRYIMLCVALALWGAFTGVWKGSLESIYADSVREEEKSKYLVFKFVITLLSNTAGPVTGIFLFIWRGDTWTMPELTAVFCSGVSLMSVAVFVLFFFDDGRTLGAESEAAFGQSLTHPNESDDSQAGNQALLTAKDVDETVRPLERESKLGSGSSSSLGELAGTFSRKFLTRESVPYIIVTSDVLMGLASGMTIKFFPLFFKNEAMLSPVSTLLINVITFPVMSACSKLAQYSSDPNTGCLGRVQVCLLTSYTGIALLVLMGSLKSVWQMWYVICPIYIARTAIMNCNYPIRKSILMNFVPKRLRGRWNSIDSVTRFGWSGSALLGGYLADTYGYGFSFLVTAAVQFCAASTWWLLVGLVPRGNAPVIDVATTPNQGRDGYRAVAREGEAVSHFDDDIDGANGYEAKCKVEHANGGAGIVTSFYSQENLVETRRSQKDNKDETTYKSINNSGHEAEG
eukprot:CAMPEP_0184495906 /NCGR_PEP_ID=MMETSP0113_2-20130426/32648_1 /TAXON_ID=91329 /ORGANISM="Norrisiella sphaerica, Strain BC52" /LENGTH=556 /DNA_ID=CAMNT_0026882315 /DNA_START=90 /DNA_END=1760 /DNA_ORIENTATION=+